MKKLIVFIAAIAFALQANAQSQKIMAKDVPSSIAVAFAEMHPNAKMIEWKKIDSKYEAAYDENSKKTYSVYDASGNLIETKVKIKESEVPKLATDYVYKNHKDPLEKEYFKITNPKGTVTYGIKVKDKKFIFDSTGNYIKTVDCKE
jgi:hypothetical protein